MKSSYILIVFAVLITFGSCQKEDPLVSPDYRAIQKVKDTEILLRNNLWAYNDLVVDVQYEMRAISLLANVADANGMVQPGKYNSYAIYGNAKRQDRYSYQFSTSKMYRDTANGNAYYKMGFYNVLSNKDIQLNPDSLGRYTYAYQYKEDDDLFVLTSNQLTNGYINDFTSKLVANAILTDKPDEIANAMVDKVLNSQNVQDAMQQLLYDMIHGKVEGLTANPEKVSQKLAEVILQELQDVDWEALVYNKLVDILSELKVNNPQQAAQALAQQLASNIESSVNQADIYSAILPVLQNFEDETLPVLVPQLAQAIYSVMTNILSEENIYNKIYPVWESFAQVDSTEISSVADTLGSVLTVHFFDADSLASSLEPFIATLRTTSTVQIPALAQSIINNTLVPLVDSINASFPGMDINPDWSNVKTILSSALTVLKSSLAGKTDAQAAAELAQGVISIMDGIISSGVENAIQQLQAIPSDQASQVIAAWIVNLVDVAQPQIVAFLDDKLSDIADLFSAEETAAELSEQIKNKVLEVFSVSNIYDLIFPVMENLSDLDVEAVAEKMADWLTDLELIKSNVSEEQLLNALTDIISDLIGEINVDNATQKLVDAILQSDIVNNIEGSVLKQVLELKIYDFLLHVEQQLNAISNIEFSLERR
jgi:hypothetical protein